MNDCPQNLEIRVYKADGSIEKFIQTEAGPAQRILHEFRDGRIFDLEKIIIAGRRSLTSFPTRQVVRLDLVSEPPVQWIRPRGIVDAVELTGAEFQALHQNPELRDPENQVKMLEDSVVGFLEIEMASQPPLFLALEWAPAPSADRPEAILCPFYPLPTPTLSFRMRTGGLAILNPFHLVRLTLFPAPQQPPAEAWPAQRANNPPREHLTRQAGEAITVRPSPDHFLADGQMKRELSRRDQSENAPAMERKY